MSLLIVINFIFQEEQKELDEITAKRQKKGRNEEDAPAEEKTILHGTVGLSNWHVWKALSDLLIYFYFLNHSLYCERSGHSISFDTEP